MIITQHRFFAGIAACVVTIAASSPALAHGDRWDGGDSGRYGWSRAGSPREAVRQCSWAAERGASRYGRANVIRINDVDRHGRGFTVRGWLAVNGGGWRDRWHDDWRRDRGTFKCRVEYGRIVDLDINGLGRY